MGTSSSQFDMRSYLHMHRRWHLLETKTYSRRPSTSPSPPLTLLDLPEQIHRRILRELGERDRKSLSIVCFQFLQCCEQTFERAPRIWATLGRSYTTIGCRIVAETEYPESSEHPQFQWAQELSTYRMAPPPYTGRDESSRPVHARSQRQQAQEEERIWLCPHVGCTLDNLTNLPETPETPVRDTRSIACGFPKCALWARHATSSAHPRGAFTMELCSNFRVYRIQCSQVHMRDVRQKLLTISQDKLRNAMQHLKMPICRHLTLGSTGVTAYFDPQRIVILSPTQGLSWTHVTLFCLDVGFCEACELEGTYTTWGFFARPCRSDASHGGSAWLDIELALARPYMDNLSMRNKHDEIKHWNAHSIPAAAMSNFVDGWWKWAEQVAVEGFDWRARLPSGFLEANRSACINFPELLPIYEQHHLDVQIAEDEQRIRTRIELPDVELYSTWEWQFHAGLKGKERFPLRRIQL